MNRDSIFASLCKQFEIYVLVIDVAFGIALFHDVTTFHFKDDNN